MPCLLVDFGASRIKTAIADVKNSKLSFVKNYKAIEPAYYPDGRCEVSSEALLEKFREILNHYHNELGVRFEGVYISSEMHGFMLVNNSNEPVSPYVSWRDERSLNKVNDQIDSFNCLKNILGKEFQQISGMKLRAGLPVFNLYHMVRTKQIKEDIQILTLPDWLALVSQDSCKKTHVTMAAGLGFYDINKNCISEKILAEFKKISEVNFSFPEVIDAAEPSGYWHCGDNKIPIYAGIGDYQCAVLGAGNDSNTLSFNLGTGSQVGVIEPHSAISDDIESRPFFDGKKLQCLTHIPSGRAFNEYIGFLEEVRNVSNGECDFWKMLSELTYDEVNNSTLDIDLAIFSSAQNYKNFSGIAKISEKTFTLKNYLTSLVRSYANQYLQASTHLGSSSVKSKIILSGGVSRNLPVLKEYFEKKTLYKVELVEFTEETFLGLMAIISASQKIIMKCQ